MKDNEELRKPTNNTDFPDETTSSSPHSPTGSTSGGVALRRSCRTQGNSRVNNSATRAAPARVKTEQKSEEEAGDGGDEVTGEEAVPVGSKVRRRFMAGSKAKWFNGKVTSYDEETGQHMILYEDGDSEECKIDELKTILVAAGSSKQVPRKPAAASHTNDKSTPKEKSKTSTSAATPTRVKSEPKEIKTDDDILNKNSTEGDNDGDVEDVTEDCLEKERAKKKDAQNQAEILSSDSSGDEETNNRESDYDVDSEGDDDDEGDESDAWDEAEDEDDESMYEDSGMEDDIIDDKQKIRRPEGPLEPPLQVVMEEKDMPSAPGKLIGDQDDNDKNENVGEELEEGTTLVQGARRRKADQAIKDRIIKLLNTGFHEQSNENEAKNAMKLAQRLMRKHNLSQAILLQERQEKNKQQLSAGDGPEILKGGIVVVRILNRKTNKPAIFARWIASLVNPICTNFDVKSYYSVSRGRKTEVAFYGIYTNCQLAAYAFKVATERTSQMMADYRPEAAAERTSFYHHSEKNYSTKSSRLSYAVGIVNGIERDVERNIQFEKERQDRQLEKKRLAAFRGEAYEESDDDNDGGGGGGGEDCDPSFPLPREQQTKTKGTAAAFDPNVISTSSDEGDYIFERANVETLFDHVDDPSLPPEERVKRDLAKKVIHIPMDDGKKWIQEQKGYWKEKLTNEEFNGLWKNAKGYAFDVWNASQRDGFPKSKAELEDIRRQRRLKEIEKEKQAAIVLVDHREKIADQVLEDQGIKLSKGRKRSRMSFDRRSYDQGIEDSKEIDINQRAIRDEVKIKKEAKRPRR